MNENNPIYANDLEDAIMEIISKYDTAKLLVDDMMRLITYIHQEVVTLDNITLDSANIKISTIAYLQPLFKQR